MPILKRYGALSERFEAFGGYDTDVAVNKIANGLSIPRRSMRPAAVRQPLRRRKDPGEPGPPHSGGHGHPAAGRAHQPSGPPRHRVAGGVYPHLPGNGGRPSPTTGISWTASSPGSSRSQDGKAEFYSGNYSFYAVEKERRFQERMKQYEKEQAKIEQLDEGGGAAAAVGIPWAMDKTLPPGHLHGKAHRADAYHRKAHQGQEDGRPLQLPRSSTATRCWPCGTSRKSYGDKNLFDGISLKVEGGERIALIGDNGTGKSTLIKMIVGELYPDDGRDQNRPPGASRRTCPRSSTLTTRTGTWWRI